MNFKIVERQASVLVFDKDEINYTASCQVFTYGDVGLMYGINGRKFYELMAEQGPQVMEQLGVKSLEGYITKAHARLMRIALKKVATLDIAHTGMCAGHEMVWVVIRGIK